MTFDKIKYAFARLADLEAQLVSKAQLVAKDFELAAKDAEIARLREENERLKGWKKLMDLELDRQEIDEQGTVIL